MICNGILSNGSHCTSVDLIDAHIVPRGFARDVMDGSKHNMLITPERISTTQHGIFDRHILCADCDRRLGDLDNYALRVLRRVPKEAVRTSTRDGECFTLDNVDGDKFTKFALSLLWRASISARPEFRSISLGPYDDAAGKVIFGAESLSNLPSFELIVALVKGPLGQEPEFARRFYSKPHRFRLADRNGWKFVLRGLQFFAKLDRQPFPNSLKPAVINANDRLFGVVVNLSETSEHDAMLEMVQAELLRKRPTSPG